MYSFIHSFCVSVCPSLPVSVCVRLSVSVCLSPPPRPPLSLSCSRTCEISRQTVRSDFQGTVGRFSRSCDDRLIRSEVWEIADHVRRRWRWQLQETWKHGSTSFSYYTYTKCTTWVDIENALQKGCSNSLRIKCNKSAVRYKIQRYKRN